MKRMASGAFVVALLFTMATTEKAWGYPGSREIKIGDYPYVISVPTDWDLGRSDDVESMKLHLETPATRDVIGHFTVHVQERRRSNLDRWFRYHVERNLPAAHGSFRIKSRENVKAGSRDVRLVTATDLENHKGYSLLDAVFVTDSHAIVMSYLHDRALARQALGEMCAVLDSFQESAEAVDRAELFYDEGRALGFDRFGLFLRLPRGWLPGKVSRSRGEASVILPGGTLKIFTFKSVSSGIDGVKRILGKRMPRILDGRDIETATFGTAAVPAFHARCDGSEDESSAEFLIGQHGKGGFAMVLVTDDEDERELFSKVAARAVLVTPAEASSLCRDASKRLKAAIRESDKAAAMEALDTLSLYSESATAVREIGKGLKSRNEAIQVECADALGRLGSQKASLALEKTLNDDRACQDLRVACVRSLGVIGGERERDALIKIQDRLPRRSPTLLIDTLNRTLANFTIPGKKR